MTEEIITAISTASFGSIIPKIKKWHEGELTQFTRALKTLDIEPIHANTPQAKGQVERANKTLQDRLVVDPRLWGINSIEQLKIENDGLPHPLG